MKIKLAMLRLRRSFIKSFEEILKGLFFIFPVLESKLLYMTSEDKTIIILKKLAAKGIEIRVVYDIGARHAEWTNYIKRHFSKAKFFLFEANDSCKSFLQRSGSDYFICTLSSNFSIVDFYSNNSTGDSVYKENTTYYHGVSPVKRNTVTLDSIITKNSIIYPDFIKIDTQGSELDILKGGVRCLKHATLVLLECPIVNSNMGAPAFQSYIDFMKEHEFIPHEILEIHLSHGVLMQVDVLFISKKKLDKIYINPFSVNAA